MPTKVTTAGFAAVPYALLDTAPDPFIVTIYAWLHRHGWGSAEGCWTSIHTLADESSIGHNTVRRAIGWLMHHGWLEARKRDGFTTAYTVKMDTPTGSGRGYPSRIREGGSPESGKGTPPESGRRTRTPLTRTQEQEPIPLTPRDAGTNPRSKGVNSRAQKENPRAKGANPRATDPARSRDLPAHLLPPDLADCHDLLRDWWSVKAKGRSSVALQRACNMLRAYSPAERTEVLSTAVVGGHQGLYPPKGHMPTRNNGHRTMSTADWDALDRVALF